ncbi:hypothetical protein D9758_015653 [Tetrapyrgos nigripes]|uniref:Uncharacterized protein n=1 Tax=Tetrapyrgos nigripes TaxID=182062 RepID=A0A8H5FNP5_9AGAR|nr:hypothetical protein D9758_015653 [Tetrapyrgos nigripes]
MKAPLPEGFIPAVIELAGRDRGDLNGPWTDPTSEEIKKIWIDLSPSDMKDKFSDYEKDITQTMTNVLIDWRNLFGKEAIKALEDELRKQNGERQKYVTDQTSSERFWDHKCYYKYPNEQPKASNLLPDKAIGSVPIEELLKNKPTSALVLTILAIDRALRLCSSASTNSNSLSDELSGDNQAKERTSEAFKSLGLGVDASRWSRIIRFACKVEESAALPDNFA